MSSQHSVCLLVTQDLHQAICISISLCSAVSSKGEFANFVRNTLKETCSRKQIRFKYYPEGWGFELA